MLRASASAGVLFASQNVAQIDLKPLISDYFWAAPRGVVIGRPGAASGAGAGAGARAGAMGLELLGWWALDS